MHTKESITHTLCLLVKEDQVLLAMKKRGFGAGKWNGVGGKLEAGETVEQAAIRETQEEIGVTPKLLEQVAVLNYIYPEKPEWSQQVAAFTVTNWQGDPTESEEMKPQWFELDNIPYDQMWESDTYWLPKVLADKKLRAQFIYNADQKFQESKITETEGSFSD